MLHAFQTRFHRQHRLRRERVKSSLQHFSSPVPSANTGYGDSVYQTNAILDFGGNVMLVSHTLFVSVCNVDVQYYPFDEQTCDLVFASWTYDKNAVTK